MNFPPAPMTSVVDFDAKNSWLLQTKRSKRATLELSSLRSARVRFLFGSHALRGSCANSWLRSNPWKATANAARMLALAGSLRGYRRSIACAERASGDTPSQLASRVPMLSP